MAFGNTTHTNPTTGGTHAVGSGPISGTGYNNYPEVDAAGKTGQGISGHHVEGSGAHVAGQHVPGTGEHTHLATGTHGSHTGTGLSGPHTGTGLTGSHTTGAHTGTGLTGSHTTGTHTGTTTHTGPVYDKHGVPHDSKLAAKAADLLPGSSNAYDTDPAGHHATGTHHGVGHHTTGAGIIGTHHGIGQPIDSTTRQPHVLHDVSTHGTHSHSTGTGLTGSHHTTGTGLTGDHGTHTTSTGLTGNHGSHTTGTGLTGAHNTHTPGTGILNAHTSSGTGLHDTPGNVHQSTGLTGTGSNTSSTHTGGIYHDHATLKEAQKLEKSGHMQEKIGGMLGLKSVAAKGEAKVLEAEHLKTLADINPGTAGRHI